MCAFSTYPAKVFRGAFIWSVRLGLSGPLTGANNSSYLGLYCSSLVVGSTTRCTSCEPMATTRGAAHSSAIIEVLTWGGGG